MSRFAFILMFLTAGVSGWAQNHGTLRGLPKSSEWQGFATDFVDVLKAPGSFQEEDWLRLTLLTGLGYGLTFADDSVRSFALRNQYAESDFLSKYLFEPTGRGIIPLPVAGFLFWHGAASGDAYQRQVGWSMFKAMAISSVYAQVLKHIFHRHRPETGHDSRQWDGPFRVREHTSFPSGHTTLAFSAASVVAHAYSYKKWVPVTAYTLAGLAGLSRVYDNKHWISDVFAGAVLGYFVGELVYQNDFENMPEEMLLPAGKVSWRHPEQVMMALSVTAVLMHTDLLQIKPLHTTISPVGFRVEILVR